jgi:DNA-binding CsgD family transcriptional regulator
MLLGGYLGQPRWGIARMEAGLAALAALPEGKRLPPGAAMPIDPALRLGTVVAQLAWSGRHAEALALGERYLSQVTAPLTADWLGGNPYADAQSGLGDVHVALGRPERARAAYAEARGLNRAVGHYEQARMTSARELEAVVRFQADHPAELQQVLAELAADQARTRGIILAAMPQPQVPQLLVLAGHWTEARCVAEAMLEEQLPGTLTYGVASATLGALARAQGDAARASTLVAEALPHGPATAPGNRFYAWAIAMQRLGAGLALDAADLPRARDWLAAHDRWLDWGGAVLGRAEGHLGWAAYHRATGDRQAARDHASRAQVSAADPRQPLALLAAHRCLAELDIADGRLAEAVGHLDISCALADACAAPYERALTLLTIAELRAADGRRDEAQAALGEARAILAPLGAAPALARAAAPAVRPAGLSPREAEVLRLVAAGRSNKEIAGDLAISVRTAERHIANLYAKIDVAGRAEAIAYAHRHRLT